MDGELWDVTDAAGVPTGETHRRGDPGFPEGLFHVVASVCVVRADGLVLITRRAAGKDWPLAWEFPAGSALSGETSPQAASRELEEETGVRVGPDALTLVGRVVEEAALFDLYLARPSAEPELALDPAEVCDSAWSALDDVMRLCADGAMAGPWTRRLAELGSRLAQLATS